MMLDGKGCLLFTGLAMLVCFTLALFALWVLPWLPWWVPLAAAFVPVALVALAGVAAVLGWMADGSH